MKESSRLTGHELEIIQLTKTETSTSECDLFTMYVGDDLPTVRRQGLLRSVPLRLHIDNVSRHDCVEVSVNGQQLPASTRTWDPVGYSYAWIGYPLWEILPQSGPNTSRKASS